MLGNGESCFPRNAISYILGLNIDSVIYWQCDFDPSFLNCYVDVIIFLTCVQIKMR